MVECIKPGRWYIHEYTSYTLNPLSVMALPFAPRRLRLALLQQQLGVARNQEYLILAGIIVAIELDRPPRRRKRWWVREWILRRRLFGQYENLMRELELEHSQDFKNFLRMEPDMFRELLERVGPTITKKST